MSVEYTKKTWYDGSEGGTPITAAELNRVETGIDDVVTQSNADKTNIDNHMASKVNSSSGAHGLRYYDDKFSYYDEINEEWVDAETGADDYEDLTNLPSINGVELLGNKVIGLLSGNIQVDSDKIGYNNAISGLSATNVKSAIDELANSPVAKTNIEAVYEETTALSAHSVDDYIYVNNLLYRVTSAISIGDSIVVNTNVELADDIEEGTEAYISNLPGSNVPNYPDVTNKPSINGVELLGNKLVGLLSTDIHINADKIGYSGTVSGASTAKAAIDALQSGLSGLHGIPSGGNTNQVLAKNSSSDYDLKWVNQTGGGGVGTVINLTASYSALFNQTVTLTGTYDTYTATFDSTGHATVNVFYIDTYAVTCQGETDSVTVTAIGLVINATVFEITTVNITTSDSDLIGETISVYYDSDPTDVRASLTFDSNLSVSFHTEDIGTYNIVIGYSNPVSFTVSTIDDIVSVTYNPTPTGSSVTPVNNIRNWLDSAKVFDKNYTTISQVLNDTTTLQTLISSQNANDYLVRSTSWVSNVCGNSTVMSYIGLNNYSANTLLANSTWLNGIANSVYIESVMNVKVPAMTSNTTPSGKCLSENFRNNGAQPYYFFNSSMSSGNGACINMRNGTIQYNFPSSVNIKVAKTSYKKAPSGQYVAYQMDFQMQNTDSSWYTIASKSDFSLGNNTWSDDVVFIKNSDTKATNYRLLVPRTIVDNTGYEYYVPIRYVQFYGRQDV